MDKQGYNTSIINSWSNNSSTNGVNTAPSTGPETVSVCASYNFLRDVPTTSDGGDESGRGDDLHFEDASKRQKTI